MKKMCLKKPAKSGKKAYNCYFNEHATANTVITVGATVGASVVAAVIAK